MRSSIPPGVRLLDLDPRAQLEACIADINAQHGDAVCCLITGDLADRVRIVERDGQSQQEAGMSNFVRQFAARLGCLPNVELRQFVTRLHFPLIQVNRDPIAPQSGGQFFRPFPVFRSIPRIGDEDVRRRLITSRFRHFLA